MFYVLLLYSNAGVDTLTYRHTADIAFQLDGWGGSGGPMCTRLPLDVSVLLLLWAVTGPERERGAA